MCTGLSFTTKDHYFGRNLDYEMSYGEAVTFTPRNFPIALRKLPPIEAHHAIIGMATVANNYPLYYDGTNEKGLSMAGLAFSGNAAYLPAAAGKTNVTSFEFVLWVLAQFETVAEVEAALPSVNLFDEAFSEGMPTSPLHWIIADRDRSITVEPLRDGLKVYDNPVGVLTNNPTFDMQLFNLNNYMHLSRYPPTNNFSSAITFDIYSRGMGALGLPGDLSSPSRFVKATFTKMNSVCGDSESESISQFFQILGSVAQQRGCANVGDEKYEITIYSSCCNTATGIYYYTTYENSQITAVDMHKENLDGHDLAVYPLVRGQQIRMQN
ncbi:choloylglycine hydrolase [Sphingomonas sp. Ag1]|jgi:choloylglycine hydrolase|uniref:choloylglycine hydrolase n=1 Tax=Sphingomonas sp. Ag1 TaxID=1642949 RepID=UPI0006226F8F|nr:choloylglycine hydrolase [Sphingomonas sp. Ag1]KKI19582.1 choloylglycine hydrolase [Sphingomonas sp. Ag1]